MILDVLAGNPTTVAVILLLSVLTWILMRTKRPSGIPPGPTPLPIIGNFIDLRGDMRKVFKRLRGQYGDIFSVFLGDKLTVVVNGYDALKETFVTNGDMFSDRPRQQLDILPELLQTSQGILDASGEVWKQNRRFAFATLRDFGVGKNLLQTKIQDEASILIKAIESMNGKPFDMSILIHNAVSNIICSIVFGKRFDYDDENFKHYLKSISNFLSVAGVQSRIFRFPFLRKLPGDITKSEFFIKNFSEVMDFIKKSITEHLEVYDGRNIDCVIDAYIKQEKLHKMKLSSDDIYGLELTRLIFDLFIAGTETTSTTLMWSILYFLHYPDIQNTVQSQVANAVGTSRLPGMEDRTRMPYLEATILEVFRHANVVPLSIFHSVSDDTTLRGYHIPKDTMAVVNIDSVMMDGNLWTNPEQFNPDRFMDADNVKKFEYLIPFGLGKRICVGEALARMELTLFLAALTRHFEFLPPEGEGPPPIEGKLGATFGPNHYMARAVKRGAE